MPIIGPGQPGEKVGLSASHQPEELLTYMTFRHHDVDNDLPPIPQYQAQLTTPQPSSSPLPILSDGTSIGYRVPTPVQPIPYPYPYSYTSPYQAPPIYPPQQQPWQSTYPSPSWPNLGTNGPEDHESALHAPKRRKVRNSKVEVISLLSDDEQGPAMTMPTQPFSTKRKNIEEPPRVYNGPIPVPFQYTLEGDLAMEAINRQSTKASKSAGSMRATKAQTKSAIKKRSSKTPIAEPSFQLEEHFPSSPPVPSALPSSLNTNYHGFGSDLTSSTQTMTPPPSSSFDPDLFQPTQSKAPEVTKYVEPQLCPEQTRLVELIARGKNVFYTGSAGCGKSTVLKAFTARLQTMGKNVRILAPTGRAALQINGTTTWTYAGWTPDHHKRTLDELRGAAHGTFVHKRFKDTDVLVIDEISMVENLHFERLNEVMKEARRKSDGSKPPAFGGVQVVVTGDFCQLPPVKPFQHCIECGFELVEKNTPLGKVHVCKRHGEYRNEDKWAFRSKAWQECNFEHVHLNTIHRQNDETFIRILQKCRIGRVLSPDDTELLMNHKCMVHHATRLFATRDEVANVNRREFERLKTMNHTYWCLDDFMWQQNKHPHLGWKGMRKPPGPQSAGPLRALEDHRFDECVQLKKGMLVVLLVNLDLAMGLCNGSQGMICGFEKYDPLRLPRAVTGGKEPVNKIFGDRAPIKEAMIKKFITDPGARYKTWPVVRFHNGQIRTIFAECSITELGDERPYSLLARTQIPLAPAWAMTIHKSQSLTLDRVIVNLSRAFEEGQVYVALSRATGLHGLKIEGDAKGLLAGLGGNPEVQAFLREKFGELDGVLSSGS